MKLIIRLGCVLYILLANSNGYAAVGPKDFQLAQTILNKFTKISIQMSDFVQRDSNGHVSHGTFYMLRPGKIRFIYKLLPLNVVSDGRNILINNTLANSWNIYPLHNTPMQILLAKHIDAKLSYLHDVIHDGNKISLLFKPNSNSNSAIYMDFAANNYRLLGWTIIDEQNLPTSIEILNEKHNIRFEKDMFNIPYNTIKHNR